MNRRLPLLSLGLGLTALLLTLARVSVAAPEAHILRIDPRAGVAG